MPLRSSHKLGTHSAMLQNFLPSDFLVKLAASENSMPKALC